eukprot:363133-Chlamydomonas_euryale.AAC.10
MAAKFETGASNGSSDTTTPPTLKRCDAGVELVVCGRASGMGNTLGGGRASYRARPPTKALTRQT